MPGLDAQQLLTKFAWEGRSHPIPRGSPDKVRKAILARTRTYPGDEIRPYFLTVYSIVRFARSQGILCQGRGSAANSAVCYCLGITSINPETGDLLFERFVSMERDEPPDIDVDFEHARREEVIQWIYETYGRSRSALCSTVTRYRAKGALRDVGKALGLRGRPDHPAFFRCLGLVGRRRREAAQGKQYEHRRLPPEAGTGPFSPVDGRAPPPWSASGRLRLTQDRLDDLVPIEPASMKDRQVVEWDKDDIEALKFMKVDVLALGMLTCMAKSFELLQDHKNIPHGPFRCRAGGPGHLRNDPQGRYTRHVPDREPRPDGDAPAPEAPDVL